jgi:hypothetical protein
MGLVVRARSAFGLVGALALATEFEDGGMVDQAVDGRGSRHGIFEDSIPLSEGEIAGDEKGAALVAFRHECEENLDFLGALLDVSDVVEDQQLEGIESLKRTR